jgi:hypothetical protein
MRGEVSLPSVLHLHFTRINIGIKIPKLEEHASVLLQDHETVLLELDSARDFPGIVGCFLRAA